MKTLYKIDYHKIYDQVKAKIDVSNGQSVLFCKNEKCLYVVLAELAVKDTGRHNGRALMYHIKLRKNVSKAVGNELYKTIKQAHDIDQVTALLGG